MKLALSVLAASAAGAVALVSVAVAQPVGRGPAAFGLLQHDANGDGRLTKAEFDTAQKARFDAFDADRDGAVTPAEIKTERQERREGMRTETIAARFDALDTDRNGQLSRAEFSVRAAADNRGKPDGRRGHGGGRHRDPQAMLSRVDVNGDGTLSLNEFSARGAEAFARADTNKDGAVTIQELQALRPGQH
jgi:Ca2+-binding EF-hand superfamily protein